MKLKIVFSFLALCLTVISYAQVTGIVVEEVDNGGSVKGRTIRVYAVLANDSDQVFMVYGEKNHPMYIRSTKAFYQSDMAGASARDSNRKVSNDNPSVKYDSWLTIGATDNYDNNTSLTIDTEDFEKSGAEIATNEGAWYALPNSKQCYPDGQKRVLLMQLTSEGGMEGKFSIMGRNAKGENFHYYNGSFTFRMGK